MDDLADLYSPCKNPFPTAKRYYLTWHRILFLKYERTLVEDEKKESMPILPEAAFNENVQINVN